jgi:hypothetical protein
MNTGPRDTRNIDFAAVCQNCYLSFCAYDSRHLAVYCPERAGRQHGVEPEIILQLLKSTGPNRRWHFLKEVKNAALNVTPNPTN